MPKLRWNAVPGAKSYIASIISEEDVFWKTTVKGTELVYPGEPPLKPGVDYLLSLVADTGASSQDEDLPCRGFSLVDENEATLVRDSGWQLTNLDLTDEVMELIDILPPICPQTIALLRKGQNPPGTQGLWCLKDGNLVPNRPANRAKYSYFALPIKVQGKR